MSTKPPRGTAAKLKQWAADGTPQKVMARRLGVGVARLKQWMEDDERLQAAYDEGVEEEHQVLRQALMNKIHTDNGAAAMFLLKCRHGYNERDQTGQAHHVQVTVNLPAAASKDDWKGRVIDAEPEPPKRVKHERA